MEQLELWPLQFAPFVGKYVELPQNAVIKCLGYKDNIYGVFYYVEA